MQKIQEHLTQVSKFISKAQGIQYNNMSNNTTSKCGTLSWQLNSRKMAIIKKERKRRESGKQTFIQMCMYIQINDQRATFVKIV